MSSIEVRLNSDTVSPGDAVTGTVTWSLDSSRVAKVAIRLFWFTQGKGSEDLEVVEEKVVDSPALSSSETFSFTAPAFPWSYSGTLMAITWAVEAAVDPGGEAGRASFTLGPDGREVTL